MFGGGGEEIGHGQDWVCLRWLVRVPEPSNLERGVVKEISGQ